MRVFFGTKSIDMFDLNWIVELPTSPLMHHSQLWEVLRSLLMARATLGVHVDEISESLSLSFSTRRQLRQPLSPCNCVFSSWLAVHTRLAKQLCHFPDLPRMLRMLTYAYSSNCFGHMMIINKHPRAESRQSRIPSGLKKELHLER